MTKLRNSVSASAPAWALLLVVACGGESEKEKTDSAVELDAGSDADSEEEDAGKGEDASASEDAAPEEAGLPADPCPTDLKCTAPQGRFLCTKPSGEVLTCSQASDCSFGMCYKLAGQGICLQLCAPPEGLAGEISIGGTVVELQPGKGLTGVSEASQEPAVAGVKVCVASPMTIKADCAMTDAQGKFTISKLPPNRNAAMAVNVTLSFEKDGYLPQLQAFGLGDGSSLLSNQVRLMTKTYATSLATSLGGTLPDATTGWLQFNAVRFGDGDPKYSYLQGTLKLATLDQVSVSSMPAAGVGPFYTDANEQPQPSGDAGVAATSASGHAYFLNVPMGNYNVSFAHPSLTCGDTPIPAVGVPGYLFAALGTACGNGVK